MQEGIASIAWCWSRSVRREFPIAQFSADTDMVTDGWVSLTSVERLEVVATTLTSEEYRSQQTWPAMLEERINAAMSRADLRANQFLRAKQGAGPWDRSFLMFRKRYRPPTLYYRDVLTGAGEAELVRVESLDAFRMSGGLFVMRESI